MLKGVHVDIVAFDSDDEGTAPDNFALNTEAVTIGGVEYAVGEVLTVTRTATDTEVAPGTLAGLGIPATITAQAGNTDVAGNQWNLAGSTDLVVDTE